MHEIDPNTCTKAAEQRPIAQSGPGGSVGLSYVDLLYAVPVAVLATRVGDVQLSWVPARGWMDVAVALTAITLGWVGHHSNRELLKPEERREDPHHPFTTMRFAQFVLEILIIAVYFGLAMVAVLPDGAKADPPPELSQAALLAIVFVLYLAWDLIDIHIAGTRAMRGSDWKKRAQKGARVTFAFLAIFAAALVLTLTADAHRPCNPIVFDVLAIGLLYTYRAVQTNGSD